MLVVHLLFNEAVSGLSDLLFILFPKLEVIEHKEGSQENPLHGELSAARYLEDFLCKVDRVDI